MKYKTIVTMVLDESGSMAACLKETMSGFTEYLDDLRKDRQVAFKLVKFNSDRTQVHPVKLAKDYPTLQSIGYIPSGMTPLYDAVGQAITALEAEIAGRRVNVLFVIMTDGLENWSHEFTHAQIVELIDAKTKQDWTFVYLGANQDAWAVGEHLHIAGGNTLTYNVAETQSTYRVLSDSTLRYTASGGARTTSFFAGVRDA